MDHKAGNQLPHGWMMGFSTVQVEIISVLLFIVNMLMIT